MNNADSSDSHRPAGPHTRPGGQFLFFSPNLNKRNPPLHASQSHHNPVKVSPLIGPVDAARPQDAGAERTSIFNEN